MGWGLNNTTVNVVRDKDSVLSSFRSWRYRSPRSTRCSSREGYSRCVCSDEEVSCEVGVESMNFQCPPLPTSTVSSHLTTSLEFSVLDDALSRLVGTDGSRSCLLCVSPTSLSGSHGVRTPDLVRYRTTGHKDPQLHGKGKELHRYREGVRGSRFVSLSGEFNFNPTN